MATQFDSQTYLRDFEKGFNSKQLDAVMKYYDPNVEFAGPEGETIRGVDTFRKFMEAWAEGFSETKLQLKSAVQNGNEVAILQHCEGRHTGEFEILPGEKIPATNKRVSFDIAEFIKLDNNGKIVRDIGLMDQVQLMRQLGVLPGTTQKTGAQKTVQR